MSSVINDLHDAIRSVEQRIFILETRISPENNSHASQLVRDKLHVVLMGPPCSGCSTLHIPVLAMMLNVPAGKSTHASNIQDEFCICCLVSEPISPDRGMDLSQFSTKITLLVPGWRFTVTTCEENVCR